MINAAAFVLISLASSDRLLAFRRFVVSSFWQHSMISSDCIIKYIFQNVKYILLFSFVKSILLFILPFALLLVLLLKSDRKHNILVL